MRMEPAAIEHARREFFATHREGMVAVYLFGSVARGSAGPRSDVDLAVPYEVAPPPTPDGLPVELEGRIEKLVGRPVQVIVLNRAPVDLVHRVLRDGVLVLDADRSPRIRFEVRARNEFFDLQPFLARYRGLPVSTH